MSDIEDKIKSKEKEIARLQNEAAITEHRDFYNKHLCGIKGRKDILPLLGNICNRFQKTPPKALIMPDPETKKLDAETEIFIKKYFPDSILEIYKKNIPREERSGKSTFFDSIRAQQDQYDQEWKHKSNFMITLYDCLYNCGLHPNIDKRDPSFYKRYNVMLEHNFNSPYFMVNDFSLLIKQEVLLREFIQPYERKLPIKIAGKLVPPRNVVRIKIASTLLLDNEIELFAAKNDFQMDDRDHSKNYFILLCKNETDELLRNPFMVENEISKSKNDITFVDPIRIAELCKIRSNEFDLIKLIAYCEELNAISPSKSVYSSTMLLRSIIDHVPPIFGCKSFTEVASSYSGGGSRAFKKSMQNLENSLRPIADHNVHAQIRKKEVLASPLQSNFAPDLDVLLGEIVRILK